LFLARDDQTIRVWDADTGVILKPLKSYTDGINSVAVSQDSLNMAGGADILENPIFNGFRSDSQLENGWVMNSPSELLFWVPPWSRIGLWRPANTAVIADWSTKLDFSQFVHGTSWEKCQREGPRCHTSLKFLITMFTDLFDNLPVLPVE
jgi:WD40 repeat protein